MSTASMNAVNAFKSACDRGQNWINCHVDRLITRRGTKFSTLRTGYSKIRPRIFPKGLSTLRNENANDFDDEECDNFLKNPRGRVYSVDVINNKINTDLREEFYEQTYINFEPKELNDLPELDENRSNEKKTKEALLVAPNIELKVIDAIATPNRYDRVNKWKSKGSNRQEKVYVKSTDDNDDDIKIIPGVLLTYHTRFTRISTDNSRRRSFQDSYVKRSWESIDMTSKY